MPACAQCGEVNPAEARLCWSCGTALPGGSRAGSERRLVTVLFADLVDFTRIAERLDPEDLKRVQGLFFRAVRAEVERFGGQVEKYIGDAVMGVFGAPVAYGDDALRAVLAGFGIREAVAVVAAEEPELGLKVRVGVNTGEAFVDLDAAVVGEGIAAGDVVVTSFRLHSAAPPNGIVVGEVTYRATERGVEYEAAEPVAAKGKDEPVRCWLAAAPRDAAVGPGARLVGRDAELAHLRGLAGSAHVVTLVGAAGIGKSRLVRELREALADEPVRWLHGRALAYGTGVSYSALAGLVKSHAGILENDPTAVVEEKVAAVVAGCIEDEPTRRWTESYLRPLAGLEGPERLHGDRRDEAFSAWRRFVEALAAGEGAVLVFEDLHWADDGQLDFIEHLYEWAGELPLTIVCTARPELLERRPSWPGVVPLEPLSTEDTAELVVALGADEPSAELLARAGGNPLYAEEFVRMLQERGGDDLPLPETVQAIIAARLDQLHPEAKEVLRAAAVVGTGFWVGAISSMSGLPPAQVERRLGELQWKELVRPQPRSVVAGESQYAFWHVLVRDVAYGQIPRAARAERHRAAARWIESLAPERADLAELLAHHYSAALEFARLSRQETEALAEDARVALRRAGAHALDVYAYPAAAQFLRDALALSPERDPELLFDLGRALAWSERGGEAELTEARDGLPPGRAAQASILLSRLALARGDRDAGLAHAERAVEALEGAPPSRERAEAVSNLAAFASVSGDHDRALEVGGEALALAAELGLDEIRAESLTYRGHSRLMTGDRRGLADLEEAVELADAVSSPGLVRSCANLAASLVELGELARAWEVYERGRVAAARFGDGLGLHWLAAELPYEHYWCGRWADAGAAAEDALRDPDAAYGEHAARSVRAWIRLAQGDHAGALEDAAAAVEFGRRTQDPGVLCSSLALTARALAEAGQREEALAAAEEALAAEAIPSFWVVDLADALHELGCPERLSQVGQVETRWLAAARCVAAGAHGEAAELFAAAGARPEEARARLRASAVLAAQGDHPGAALELERARAFYESVGADGYLRSAAPA